MKIRKGIFREYDIRGIVGKDLSKDVYAAIGQACGRYMRRKKKHNCFCIGRDGRFTSKDYANALIDGLTSTGMDVIDIGQVPTPLLYYGLFTLPVDGGIMVTASHNPKEYNGLKVAVGKATIHGKEIQKLYKLCDGMGEFPHGNTYLPRPVTITRRNLAPKYMNRVAGDVKLKRKLKVVVDAGNGPGGVVAVPLYEKMGCEVIPLYCEVDGSFPNHHPDPTIPENLKKLISTVKRTKADCGIAFDGDVDRIGIVDETGDIIWGDRLLIIFARDILKDRPGATVISEVKASRVLFEEIRKHGGNPVMWKTGHSLIKAAMRQFKAEVAGEMSGHMFFKHRWYGFDDAIYAGARLLEILAAGRRPLSRYLANVRKTFVTPEIRLETEESKKYAIVKAAREYFIEQGLEVNDIDGARIEFSDGWGLLRASNTSPVLVMRCEANTRKRLNEIVKLVDGAIHKLSK